jgi:DivIVA domain-containing protein
VSLLLVLVILAVIAGIAVVATGRGEGLAAPAPERSPRGTLPAGEVGRADVDALRFTLALRGYRMDEVDVVIDRLLDEVDRRDARIAELEGSTATTDESAVESPAESAAESADGPHGDAVEIATPESPAVPRDDRRDADQDA